MNTDVPGDASKLFTLSFNVELDKSSNKAIKPGPFELRKLKTKNESSCLSTSSDLTDRQKTPKSVATEMSLGAKIQQKATQNQQNNNSRRPSVSSDKDAKSTATSSTLLSNRTLNLRIQQSAKAKKESCNGQTARRLNDPTTSSVQKAHLNKDNLNSSRSTSPSLNTQSVLNVNNLQHAAAKDAFLRRKNYDPMKAVQNEKLKRQLKQTKQDDLEQTILSNSTIDLTSQSNHSNKQVF